jgi:hypothetical protein
MRRIRAAALAPWVLATDEQGLASTGVPPDPGYPGFPGKDHQGNAVQSIHDIRKLTLWGNLMGGGAGVVRGLRPGQTRILRPISPDKRCVRIQLRVSTPSMRCRIMRLLSVGLLLLVTLPGALDSTAQNTGRQTSVSIVRDEFRINGKPTYQGRSWQGHRIEGLLLNSRMVQATFDDLNSQTRSRWSYPDTGSWDPERNTREFIAAMPEWRRHGLLAITINLQGGSPQGYSKEQPWHNSAFTESGDLRPDYFSRLQRVLDRADELGMVVIVGYFYFGQDERLRDESAVVAATDAATNWLLDRGYTNVLVEVNNECNIKAYDHDILRESRVHELVDRVKRVERNGRRLLAGTSYGGRTIPLENVVRASDFLLLHGNGVNQPEGIVDMVQQTRKVAGYRPMPVIFNEDDHFDFDKPSNNFTAAISAYASWGYFDYRMQNEGFDDGYQSVPVNWGISSPRKKAFFDQLSAITGERK